MDRTPEYEKHVLKMQRVAAAIEKVVCPIHGTATEGMYLLDNFVLDYHSSMICCEYFQKEIDETLVREVARD